MRADGDLSETADGAAPAGAPPRPRIGRFLAGLYQRPVFALDALLRRLNRVFEYTNHPHCIMRAQVMRSDREVALTDGTLLLPGQRFLDLHLWSEQVPRAGRGGPDLAWARRMRARFDLSLRELARWLPTRPDLADIEVLRANLNFTTDTDGRQVRQVIIRFGFEEVPDGRPLTAGARLHRFGENILLALLVLASNPRTFRWDVFRRGRVLTYISRDGLLRRYGPGGA